MVHIIWYIILGFLAGLIARLIMHVHMIVMASHCYGWFDSLVYGSDAERVLRQAPCPVPLARDS